MPRISPFRGLLFDEARAGPPAAATAPPYDTVDRRLRRRLMSSSPYSIVHLDLPDAAVDADDQYTGAASLLSRWRTEGALRLLSSPALYPYEMRFRFEGEPQRVRGVICEVEIEPWGGSIVPHEDTMPGPVDDRLRLARALRTNLSAIYALFAGPRRRLRRYLDDVTSSTPLVHVTDEEGVEHRMWVVDDDVPDLPQRDPLLIADGHHRYATALRYRDEMRAAHGPGPWDRQMMFLVDAAVERPPVLPIHRVLLHAPPPEPAERVRDLEELSAALDDERLTFGVIRREDGVAVHEIGRLEGAPPTVCALTHHVPALRDVANVRFTHDAVEAEASVRAGEAALAYLLPPTSAARIRAVIEAGERMPQKSTYFWPKPRTGMVLQPIG